jgi:hypothetical protein
MGCTNVIRYKVGWKNVSNYCKRCENKRREGWSASTCPGTGMWGCGKLIWSPPGKKFALCPDCSAKQKAERENKKRTKPCATPNCRNIVEYQADWDNPPNFCKSCKAKRDKVKGKKTLTSSDVLPGSGRTVGNIGCTHATVSGPNKYGGQHVTVYNRNLAHHEHYSYDTDIDGNYVPGSAHITDAMAGVLRKHGHDRT